MKALEIFIGLFFVYLVLSTLVTSVSEILIARRNTKARVLRESIRRLFCGNKALEQEFFNDPEIKSLIDPKRLEKAEKNSKYQCHVAPSALESETFAKVLLRILEKEPSHTLGTFRAALESWCVQSQAEDQKAKRLELAGILYRQIDNAAVLQQADPQLRERDALLTAIGAWYEEGMERSRGIFRRIVQKYVLFSALLITVLLNADTIRIVQALSNNEAVLSTTVKAALTQKGEISNIPSSDKSKKDFQEIVEKLENSAVELENVGVPLGWDSYEWEKLKQTDTSFWLAAGGVLGYFFLKIVGLGATTIAASLGAPFWYDILNKLAKVRSSASSQGSQKSEGGKKSEARTGGTNKHTPTQIRPAKTLSQTFSEPKDTFDIDIAYWTVCFSKVVYLPFSAMVTTISRWGLPNKPLTFGDEDNNSSKGTQGFVATNNECIIICFRGTQTEEKQDIITDIDIDQDSWNVIGSDNGPVFSVHGGFLKAYLSVRDKILAEVKLRLEENPNRSVWFTGHSLGAGLATLCAVDLLARKIPISGLYTYGSPRTGNKTFASYLMEESGSNIFRFVNEDDPVTEVPLEAIQDYCHVGNLRYLDRFNRLKTDRATWNRVLRKTAFWLDLNDQASSRKEAFEALKVEFSKRAGYHSIDAYVDKIAEHSGQDARKHFALND
ncbi:MAG: lipase family protein [Opitutaceae bacterium]